MSNKTIPRAHKKLIKEILNIDITDKQYTDLLEYLDTFYPAFYFLDCPSNLTKSILNEWWGFFAIDIIDSL